MWMYKCYVYKKILSGPQPVCVVCRRRNIQSYMATYSKFLSETHSHEYCMHVSANSGRVRVRPVELDQESGAWADVLCQDNLSHLLHCGSEQRSPPAVDGNHLHRRRGISGILLENFPAISSLYSPTTRYEFHFQFRLQLAYIIHVMCRAPRGRQQSCGGFERSRFLREYVLTPSSDPMPVLCQNILQYCCDSRPTNCCAIIENDVIENGIYNKYVF